jgi:hypothetical protein
MRRTGWSRCTCRWASSATDRARWTASSQSAMGQLRSVLDQTDCHKRAVFRVSRVGRRARPAIPRGDHGRRACIPSPCRSGPSGWLPKSSATRLRSRPAESDSPLVQYLRRFPSAARHRCAPRSSRLACGRCPSRTPQPGDFHRFQHPSPGLPGRPVRPRHRQRNSAPGTAHHPERTTPRTTPDPESGRGCPAFG